MVRRQAAFHSALVMWVAASQKPMQSLKVLPPPPGALGADWLELPEDEPGDRAKLLWAVPPVANWVGSCGERGDTAGICWVGGRVDDGEVDGATLVTGAVVLVLLPRPSGLVVVGTD